MSLSSNLVLKVKKLNPNAILLTRGSAGAAGYDLSALSGCIIEPYGKALVPTGLAIAIPPGHYGRIAPRSSLAWKHHIDVGAGVVDEDFRGHVHVVLFNHNSEPFEIKQGDRIAQLIIEVIAHPKIQEVDTQDDTERGQGGFGSTGI
jgi:dUTP pyrophosphatase